MGSYTVRDDPTIDRVVEGHLDTITGRFLEAGGARVRAILITGGFGRGEGSVVVDPETGPRPLNDYDMVVIQRGRRGAAIEGAARSLESELGVMVDVGIFDERKLPTVDPTILVYEIREGYRLLWGDREALRFPSFEVEEIPLEEGTDLLFNRGMSLLRSTVAAADGWPGRSRAHCAIHIQKATQAWGDAALLAAGRYTVLYRDRPAALAALAATALPPVTDLVERYRTAVERKLEPRPSDPDPALAQELAPTVHDHELVFRWYEERRLGRPLESWASYEDSEIRRTAQIQRPGEALRNVLRNVRLYRGSTHLGTVFRSPKDRLVGAFPRVLFEGNAAGDEALRRIGVADSGVEGKREYLRRWH